MIAWPLADECTEFLENHPIDEIRVDEGASLVRPVTSRDIQLFAAMSGDVNPAHVDAQYARSSGFQWDARNILRRSQSAMTGGKSA